MLLSVMSILTMRSFFFFLFCIVSILTYGQLIIVGGTSSSSSSPSVSYGIDTLRISKDTIFVEVSQFTDNVLTWKELQLIIDDDAQEIVFHGITEQWYQNGSKKLEGQFEFGKKMGLWKYWNENGDLKQDIDFESCGIVVRGGSKFYIDGLPVEIRKE